MPSFRLLILLALFPAVAGAAERPNILFIYADDQSHRTVGCYPESFDWVRTPNIDALAENGIRFTHAYIGTWCMASRASLLTGHHQFAIESMRMEGPYPGSEYDPDKCPFWPKHFRERGYLTAQIGKWHTGTDTGRGRDWDYQVVWNRPKFTDNAGRYFDNQMITFDDGETRLVKGYSTDNYTDWAIEFIRGEKGREDAEKPWYLWLCYGAVHGPYTPAPRHVGDYKEAEVPIPADIFGKRADKPTWMQNRSAFREKDGVVMSGKKTFADAVRQYHEGVLAIDEGVGKLVAALKETGQLDNTLVVYTADQGFAWGQHGLRCKLAGYDATIRAPLIMSMPARFPGGRICRAPVGGVDLVPTFHRLAEVETPWQMHGHDLTPLLENPDAAWPHPVLIANTFNRYGSDTAEIPEDGGFRGGIPWYVMIRHERYKYIHSLLPDEIDEFYDLDRDPDELANQAGNPEFEAKVAASRQLLKAELERTGAPPSLLP